MAAAFLYASSALAQDSDGDGVPDSSDAFPCDASLAGVAFAPGEGVHGSVVFEDLWPSQGDLDFNDLVLTYNHVYRLDAAGRVVRFTATFNAQAVGGSYDNGLGLHLPIPRGVVGQVTRSVGGGAAETLTPSTSDAELTVVLSDNLRELFGGAAGPINSRADEARRTAQTLVVDVVLATPTAFASAGAPHDVFIFRSASPSHEIHRPEFSGTSRMNQALFGSADDGSTVSRRFVDFAGLPFALVFPTTVPYPREGEPISSLFPNIVHFAASAGASHQSFYTSNVVESLRYADVNGQGAPSPSGGALEVDRSCLPSAPPATTAFEHTGAAQTWTVPSGVTSVRVEAWGAEGGRGWAGAVGGRGAHVAGTVSVSPGQVLTIVVGGQGGNGNGSSTAGGGGGGGSFVSHSGTPLVIAGGGGGGSYSSASSTGFGGNAGPGGGVGGYPSQVRAHGQGGYSDNGGGGGLGSGGGGWLSAGMGNNWVTAGGAAAGGPGSPAYASYGGFGGFGGGGGSMHGGGGGGGYTGGNGGSYTVGGGGGGSYNAGSSPAATAEVRSGHGRVVLTYGGEGGSTPPPGGTPPPESPTPGTGNQQAFVHTGSAQSWTVPPGVGAVRIEAFGAEGGRGWAGALGGRGARIAADVAVSPGQVLTVVVGGQGGNGNGSSTAGGGGGGGSFVSRAGTPLVIAGGGGGGSYSSGSTAGGPGNSGQAGGLGGYPSQVRPLGQGGYSDNGGGGGLGAGGGGWLGAGMGNNWVTTGGAAAGGAGSPAYASYGGFGGFGGGGGSMHGGGGGGGYTGGNGGSYTVGGGGGGSHAAGTNVSSESGVRTGHGAVTVSW